MYRVFKVLSCRALLLILLTGCTSFGDMTPVPTVNPDQIILFHNGVVLTMNSEQPEATALSVHGEKIIEVDSDEEILARQKPGATVIDLQGATVMPGFVDAHSHLFNDAEQYLGLSLVEV